MEEVSISELVVEKVSERLREKVSEGGERGEVGVAGSSL